MIEFYMTEFFIVMTITTAITAIAAFLIAYNDRG